MTIAEVRTNMKAQASVETLSTLGMVLAFTVPVLLLLLSASQYGAESTAIYQTQSSARIVADTINDVFVQGNGATKQVLINLPGNTDSLEITGNEVIIILTVQNGKYDAVAPIFANVHPDTDAQQITEVNGLVSLTIKNTDGEIEVYKNA